MRHKWEEYFPERVRMRKRCRRAGALALLILLPLYAWRVISVNAEWQAPPRQVVPLGEEVGFGSNYIDDPQLQNSDGYFIRVRKTELATMESVIERSAFTREEFEQYMIFEQRRLGSLPEHVLIVETEIRNESNTDTGIDCIFWRLQLKETYMTQDSHIYSVLNPDMRGSERFRLKVGMTKTVYLAYPLSEHLWPEAPERILEEDPLLVLTEAPVSLRMKLK